MDSSNKRVSSCSSQREDEEILLPKSKEIVLLRIESISMEVRRPGLFQSVNSRTNVVCGVVQKQGREI